MPSTQTLPEILPGNPLHLATDWLAEAVSRRLQPNPDAMVLATADASGNPSARVVLCKDIRPEPGVLHFYTNYDSRKGGELAARPRAAVVFHWDALRRQVRIEGPVRRTSAQDSDRYFASRARDSQLGAHASRQSRPIPTAAALREQLAQVQQQFGDSGIPRPQHWGGFELWAEAVELWVEGAARLHDRARWTRTLSADGDGFRAGPWTATRLQP